MSMKVEEKTRESSISAVITRADGRVVNLGIIAHWHKNPFKRMAWNAYIIMKGWFNGRSRSK